MGGTDEAQVPLADQVPERQTPAEVVPAYRHHEFQVGLEQTPQGLLVAVVDFQAERLLFLERQAVVGFDFLAIGTDVVAILDKTEGSVSAFDGFSFIGTEVGGRGPGLPEPLRTFRRV